jgi:hypothetical protein
MRTKPTPPEAQTHAAAVTSTTQSLNGLTSTRRLRLAHVYRARCALSRQNASNNPIAEGSAFGPSGLPALFKGLDGCGRCQPVEVLVWRPVPARAAFQ